MSSRDEKTYRLTPAAWQDLDDIWRYSAETWSLARADKYIDDLAATFEVIAATPMIAREFSEFTPVVRILVHQRHLIVFSHHEQDVVIVRMLGARQDWLAILKAADL